MNKKYYVTTAIAYPNGVPHLGHALEIVQADVIARFQRLLGKEVIFQTGTDEHGSKNWETAQKRGVDVLSFLDENVAVFKKLYEKLGITNDLFIRTSDKKVHYPAAQALWKKLVAAGDIYKKKYNGQYCTGCEAFKTEKELIDGKCPNHPNRNIQTVEEENYFFKLSKYKEKVSQCIESNEYEVVPHSRKNEILSFLKEAKDISFSRPKSSLPWGIPVPDDEDQVMYVWCDALANYITNIGYSKDEDQFNSLWPADVHVIGKDILRFHAAFWPAMLLSAGVKVPKQLFVHGFILSEGKKMGKSLGNVIEPFDQIEKYGADQFRFYVLECMPYDGDGEYSEKRFIERINTELVANIGNFCYRALSFLQVKAGGSFDAIEEDEALQNTILSLAAQIKSDYETNHFRAALQGILELSAAANKYFQQRAPWKLIAEDEAKTKQVLGTCVNIVKILSIALSPIMPSFSAALQKQLNLSDLSWNDINFDLKKHSIAKPEIVIHKIDASVAAPKKKESREISLSVDKALAEKGFKAKIAVIEGITVKKKHEGLEKEKKAVKGTDPKKVNEEYLALYKELGLDDTTASDYLRSFLSEKGKLPQINTFVDSYNVTSLKTSIAVGGHDLNKVKGNIHLRKATDKDHYIEVFSEEEKKIPQSEYVYVDDKNQVLCRFNIKQGEHTKVDNATQNALVIVDGTKSVSEKDLDDALNDICKRVVKYCGGEYKIVKPTFPINLKVAKVLEVKKHPDADKLYVIQLDVGDHKRQIVSGLVEYYKEEELVGKHIVVVSNLKAAKLRGIKSEGMLLAAKDDKTLEVLTTDAKPGSQVGIDGLESSNAQISFDEFMQTEIILKNAKPYAQGKELTAKGSTIQASSVADGTRVR